MITLHELHQRGGKLAEAVVAFGALHPRPGPAATQPCDPDWKAAEEHFRAMQTRILRQAHLPLTGLRERERRAGNAAADILLTLAQAQAQAQALNPPAVRCPFCQTHDPRLGRP